VFQTLPTQWGTRHAVPDTRTFDYIIHMGLGNYTDKVTLLLEDGAYNQREGTDAAGLEANSSIVPGWPAVLKKPASDVAKFQRLHGAELEGGYTVSVIQARVENRYICNETHFLSHLAADTAAMDDERARPGVYFIHIPFARDEDNDFSIMAAGVGSLIASLVAD
jgi:hypothetical protein